MTRDNASISAEMSAGLERLSAGIEEARAEAYSLSRSAAVITAADLDSLRSQPDPLRALCHRLGTHIVEVSSKIKILKLASSTIIFIFSRYDMDSHMLFLLQVKLAVSSI